VDTIYETVEVNFPQSNLGRDTSFCNSFKFTLLASGVYKTYKWSNNSTAKTLSVNKSSTYWLCVTDYYGCISYDSIVVDNLIADAQALLINTVLCFKDHVFKLKKKSFYKSDSRFKTAWYFSVSTLVWDTVVNKSFVKSGVNTFRMTIESNLGCRDSLVQNLKVWPNTLVGFTVNQSKQCLNSHRFNFANTSVNTHSITNTWDLGNQ